MLYPLGVKLRIKIEGKGLHSDTKNIGALNIVSKARRGAVYLDIVGTSGNQRCG